MYKCSVCGKGVIFTDGKLIRACQPECAEATVLAEATASMKGAAGIGAVSSNQ